ncbi:tRNA (adenosine(37)-N6)-threonylcarbamoyltransferase complex dimerization subunit type 1 TsaB [Persicobacter psychrovividus]|uniref:tRNA (Adenosine(37)-N6)-threonylcarbamoyltransferase complex dimerization subunit type 1 TsaB n=1 Tax=Persicobacter psychrovividus TaxID=387638 RepID=A0ABM7VGX3_9BACT|nr:tRNA (adenosine(37)-N6)-threonylcarbamoyltransferase complex dimerization subunit type 1 TsaB [Persicobacter psychrovividus]
MATILNIETATPVCSVAIFKDGERQGFQELFIERSHSSLLTVVIDQLMKNIGLSMKSLDAVAVSAGPGSYTGLRIGVSTAKGICHALNIPLIAIDTLSAMVRHISYTQNQEDALYCPMLDARRMEVYCQLAKANGEMLLPTQPKILEDQQNPFEQELSTQKIIFFGNGMPKCKEILRHENAIFLENITPSSIGVGMIAEEKFKAEQFEDLAYFEPFYLKAFQGTKPKKRL